ncbi:hypothetical protein BKA69DRAFT_3201 [Paraphysoderma sedebokerense]|nr:hypothetical protein BKA69DRAFT_3201 [Paraphysoderma sedebokerense]
MEPGEIVNNFISKLNHTEGKKTSPEDSLADRGQKDNEVNDEMETNAIETGVTAEKERGNNRQEYNENLQANGKDREKATMQATEGIGTKEVGKVENEKERAEEKSKGRTYDREKGEFERNRGRDRNQNRHDRRMSVQPGRGKRRSRSRSTSRSRARSPFRRHGTFYRNGQDRNASRGGRDRRGFDDRRDDARSYDNRRNQDNRGSSSKFDTYKPDYAVTEPNIKIKRESSPRPTDRHQWRRSPSPRQSHRQQSLTPRQQSQSNSQSSMNNLFTYINPNSSGPQHMHQLTNNASDPNIAKFLEMMNVQMQMLPGFNQQFPTGQSLPPPVFNDAFTYIPPTSQHSQPAVPQHHGNQQQDLLSLLPSMLPGMSMQNPNTSNIGMNMPNQQFFVPMGHSPPLPPSQPGAYPPQHMHHPGAHNDASTAHHQFMGYPPVQQHQQNSSIPKMGGMGLGQGQGDWMNR